ncbi:MAG: DUF4412 domain-containing protein [Deltaproteobacteria bacterium]|nr:DUF4412 domain-containing protein [Deltaproteobacteria bacterium]
MNIRFGIIAVAAGASLAAVACQKQEPSSEPGMGTETTKQQTPQEIAQPTSQASGDPASKAAEQATKPSPAAPIAKDVTDRSGASSPAPFEGEIKLDYHPAKGKGTRTFTYLIKGDQLRYDQAPAPQTTPSRAVVDLTQDRVVALGMDKKPYVEMSAKPSANAETSIQVARTGKIDTVAGHACEEWMLTDTKRQETIDACVASGIPYFMLLEHAAKGKVEPDWATALTRNRAFPLRLIHRNRKGEEIASAQVSRIEPRKLEDKVFAVPLDDRKIEPSPGMKLPGVS